MNPSVPSRLRLLLADDHTLVRAGLRALLESLPDVEVVAEAGDGEEAFRLATQLRPDVVLADIGMRGGGGLGLLEQVRATLPDTRVIMVSMHANIEYVQRALKLGAHGYLLKDAAATELEAALAAARRNETYLGAALSRLMVDSYFRRGAEPLTPRQRETLKLIAEGFSTKEIAAQLGVSIKTVETHRQQLRERLGIHDTAGLVKYAQRTGLIPPEG